jgi:hypothetical protein
MNESLLNPLTFDEIPSGLERPAGKFTRSRVRAEATDYHFSRRSLFKTIFVAAVALSITALDVVAKTNKAYAATNWGDCPNWNTRPDTTTDWINCNPNGSSQGRIAENYCNANGYHRVDTVVDAPGGYRTEYRQRDTSCTGRNAWEWFRNGVDPDPPNKRCSDGQVRVVSAGTPGSWANSTCKRLL